MAQFRFETSSFFLFRTLKNWSRNKGLVASAVKRLRVLYIRIIKTTNTIENVDDLSTDHAVSLTGQQLFSPCIADERMTSQSALECLCRSPIDCDHSSAAWRYPSTADHCRAYCQGGITATVRSAELPEHCLRTFLRQCCAVARYSMFQRLTWWHQLVVRECEGALTFA